MEGARPLGGCGAYDPLLLCWNGATPSSSNSDYWDGNITWITPQDLGSNGNRYIKTSARKITQAGYESCGAAIAATGALVISTRAPIGHVAVLDSPACVNQGCRLIVPTSTPLNSEYLHYSLLVATEELKSSGQGTTFAELSADALASFRVPFPPDAEQIAIVRFLDHADRRIRRSIRVKEKLIALLEEQKRVVIHQAVTGRIDVRTGQPYPAYKPSRAEWLGDVPEHWEVVAIKRISLDRCDGPFGSGLKSSHYTDHGIRVVRLQNIGHGEFNDSDVVYISASHYATLGDHSVEAGDVLIAGLGDPNHPAGRACVAPACVTPAMVKADCFRFRLNVNLVDPKFVALQLTATAGTASEILSTGATRKRTNLQTTSARLTAIPSLQEQCAIVEYATARTSRVKDAQQVVEREIAVLAEHRTRPHRRCRDRQARRAGGGRRAAGGARRSGRRGSAFAPGRKEETTGGLTATGGRLYRRRKRR